MAENILYAQGVVLSAGGHYVGSTVQVSCTIRKLEIETGLNGWYNLIQGLFYGYRGVATLLLRTNLRFGLTTFTDVVSIELNIPAFIQKGLNYILFRESRELLDAGIVKNKLTIIPEGKCQRAKSFLRVRSLE